jgi:hypothetical protein
MSVPEKPLDDKSTEPVAPPSKPKAGTAEALKEALKRREQESRDPKSKVKRLRK